MFAERIKTNLPTELLRTLVTVCEFRSVTKAAQLLQLTQPAVLQQIRKLEIIIGSDIIDRKLAGINLTETGSEILKSAQRLLSINDKIILECGSQTGLQIVRLGVPNLFAKSVLPKIVEEIRQKAPRAQLQICCDNSPNVLRMLRLGYLDIAFAYGEAQDMADALGSWVEEIGWVRASDFAAPDGPVPLISSPNVLRVDQIATDALKRNKRPYQIVFSAVDFGARFAAVAAGLGYLPLTRRLVPPNLVIEEDTLPPLGNFMVGIFVREDFNVTDVRPLVAALVAVARPEACVTDRALARRVISDNVRPLADCALSRCSPGLFADPRLTSANRAPGETRPQCKRKSRPVAQLPRRLLRTAVRRSWNPGSFSHHHLQEPCEHRRRAQAEDGHLGRKRKMAELIVLGRAEEMQIKAVGKKGEPQHPTRDAQHLPRHLGSIHDDPTPNGHINHTAIPADKHAHRQVTLTRERFMARERGLSGCPVASWQFGLEACVGAR